MANKPEIIKSNILELGLSALAPAKINRFLHILNRKPDRFHQIQTGFQFTNLCDRVHISITKQNVMMVNDPLSLGDNNLCIKAAKKFFKDLNISKGCKIAIEKKIPIGGGMGGGSSNAATTFVLLNEFFNSPLSEDELIKMGNEVGSDIPAFIFGFSSFATGTGNILQRMEWEGEYILLGTPRCNISTKMIFNHPKLPRLQPSVAFPIKLDKTRNDCQDLVKKLFPEIESMFYTLAPYGTPRLTGTGSAVFVVDPVYGNKPRNNIAEVEFQNFEGLNNVTLLTLSNRSALFSNF